MLTKTIPIGYGFTVIGNTLFVSHNQPAETNNTLNPA